MGFDVILIIVSIGTLTVAVWLGPMLLVIRAVLRCMMSPSHMRRWQNPTRFGVSAGMIAACAVSGLTMGVNAVALAAVLCLLVMLATADFAWRWLPLEWTISLIGLGVILALYNGNWAEAAIGLVIGAGTLWVLQFTFRVWRGTDALGTGDIWLAAGLGALAGSSQIPWVLCLAALSALSVTLVSQRLASIDRRNRHGVAYGAHLCIVHTIQMVF